MSITLAEELFKFVDVRQRLPEERLFRLVESVFDDVDCEVVRLTWDWYDSSLEIYLDASEVPEVDLSRLWEAGFAIVWVHPSRCTKNGQRDHDTCRCPGRRKGSE
jgi:hypothetical protein